MMDYCTATVFGERGFAYPCTRKAKVERNGKGYCTQHDPVRQAEQGKLRHEVWEKEYKAKEALARERARRRRAEETACAGFTTEQLEQGILGIIATKEQGRA